MMADRTGLDRLSREVRLVVLCCRRPQDDATLTAIRHVAGAVDWPRVAAIVRRHRVAALVHRALLAAQVTIPSPIAAELASAARQTAITALKLAAETQRLVRAAEEAGLAVLVLKGAALASLAYGDLTIKQAVDIDLAVAPHALPAAREVLRTAGYVAAPVVVAKDEPWHHPRRDTRVELHAGLVDHDAWLAGVGVGGAVQRVMLGDAGDVPTLADAELFAYLCVHGAMHGWSRLKWLADLAAYLAGKSPTELRVMESHAARVGAGRAAAQALLLCADLFGTTLDPGDARRLRASAVNRWLVANALRSFTGPNETVELDAQPLGTIRIHAAQIVFSGSWADRVRLVAGKLRLGGTHEAAGDRRSVTGWLIQRWRRSAATGRPRA